MSIKKSIAVIGATGKMGSLIARKLAAAGYRMLLISKKPVETEALIRRIKTESPAADVEAVGCAFHGSWEADVIIPAVPRNAEPELADMIREVATQKVVLSISNETRDENVSALQEVKSGAEQLQEKLPHSKIVKAFNTGLANQLDRPGDRSDVFIAGDDEDAVQTVGELVLAAGFYPIRTGRLNQSRILEKMNSLLLQINQHNNLDGIGWKIVRH